MRDRSKAIWIGISLWCATASQATTFVSNLGEPLEPEFISNGTDSAHAASFTTGAAAVELTSITVSVFTDTSGTSELRLRANSAGSPGALIETLGSQAHPSSGNVLLTYNSPGTPVLSANTTYWVTLGEAGSGDFQWDGTTSQDESSPASWQIGNQVKVSTDGGFSWHEVELGPSVESAKLAVEGTELPAIALDLVTVGNPGNACDTQSQGCFGAVAYPYQIGKHEITNAQYAAFLNAVAATDTTRALQHGHGCPLQITRTGSPGSYTYSVVAGNGSQADHFVLVLRRAALRQLAPQRPADPAPQSASYDRRTARTRSRAPRRSARATPAPPLRARQTRTSGTRRRTTTARSSTSTIRPAPTP